MKYFVFCILHPFDLSGALAFLSYLWNVFASKANTNMVWEQKKKKKSVVSPAYCIQKSFDACINVKERYVKEITTIRRKVSQHRGGCRPQCHFPFIFFYEAIFLLTHTQIECLGCSSTWAGGKRPSLILCSNRPTKDCYICGFGRQYQCCLCVCWLRWLLGRVRILFSSDPAGI